MLHLHEQKSLQVCHRHLLQPARSISSPQEDISFGAGIGAGRGAYLNCMSDPGADHGFTLIGSAAVARDRF